MAGHSSTADQVRRGENSTDSAVLRSMSPYSGRIPRGSPARVRRCGLCVSRTVGCVIHERLLRLDREWAEESAADPQCLEASMAHVLLVPSVAATLVRVVWRSSSPNRNIATLPTASPSRRSPPPRRSDTHGLRTRRAALRRRSVGVCACQELNALGMPFLSSTSSVGDEGCSESHSTRTLRHQ